MRSSTVRMVARLVVAAAQDVHNDRPKDALALLQSVLHCMEIEHPDIQEERMDLAIFLQEAARKDLG